MENLSATYPETDGKSKNSTLVGQGMSRASKKRAKKRKKAPVSIQQTEKQGLPKEEKNGSLDNKVEEVTESKRLRVDEEEDKQGDGQPQAPVGGEGELYPSMPEGVTGLLDLVNTDEANEALASLTAQERATLVLSFLFSPADVDSAKFYKTYWEKEPLCAQAGSPMHRKRFEGILSKKTIMKAVKENTYCYGRDLNLTRYEMHSDGVKRRRTLDMQVAPNRKRERSDSDTDNYVAVDPDHLWSKFDQGCTVRLLCPHKHSNPTHSLLSLMESEWSCMVGGNAYLTPPSGSQGFAPHFDDIEAFCLQLEGRKRWKVYAPVEKSDRLPRVSSEDFTEDMLQGVKPVMDVVLEPGDVLYMPRGWIHQACTIEGDNSTHSLHLTMSTMQQWSWIDLMEMLIPEAMEAAASGPSTMLRQGLPRGFLDYMGAMNDPSCQSEVLQAKEKADNEEADDDTENGDIESLKQQYIEKLKEDFKTEAKKKIMKIAKEAIDMIDGACDELGKRFLSDRLPPILTPAEKSMTCDESKDEILPHTMCRITRPGIARLVVEDDKAVLYHCVDNSRVFHEIPLSPMEFELDDAPAMEQLLTTNENEWVRVADLVHDSIEDKVGIAKSLFDEGILCIQTEDI